MTIFLTVLKIIGIVLLVLLCLILAAVLLVLFVPVRYQADGAYREKPEAKLQITWLLHLLTVRAAFDGSFAYSLRIAGIRLFPKAADRAAKAADAPVSAAEKAAKEETRASEEVVNAGGTGANADGGREENKDASYSSVPEAEPEKSTAAQQQGGGTKQSAGSVREERQDGPAANAEKSQKQPLSDKVYVFFRKIRDKLETICDKIRNIEEIISYYTGVLQREETKQAVRLVLNQLMKIMRHVLPRKMDVRLVIGTGDPASTGQIMALQGMLYPILQDRVCIVPDFEEKHVEGTFHIKGHITVFRLLVCALRVVISKNFRQLIRLLRKKGGNIDG